MNHLECQTINLEIVGENESKTVIIDSIGYNKEFTNYNNLEVEINSLKKKLTRQGYIDTTIEQITKQNDTLFKAELFLGKKINKIRIYYDSNFNGALLNFINHNEGDGFFELDILQLESSLKELNSKIAEQGDPFSTLQLVNISKLNSDLISSDLKIITNQKNQSKKTN